MPALRHTSLSIPAEHVWLDAALADAAGVPALVLLVQNGCVLHGDLREPLVAQRLEAAGHATLCADLLTRHEEQRDPDARYNVPLMSARLLAIIEWIDHQPALGELPLAIVASGTPCGAAIRAAARRPERVRALVCRGGRPDLAGAGPLKLVGCPTRFIVGGEDRGRERFQRSAFELLCVTRDWRELEGVDEDFRAPGALERAAALTLDWLERSLPRADRSGDEDSQRLFDDEHGC